MSPILGIIASQNYIRTLPTSYDSIATSNPTSGASITFSSIPSTYKHLQIRYMAQTDRATYPASSLYLQFNGEGDGTNNLSYHRITGDGSSAGAYGTGATDRMYQATISSSAAANVFAAGIIDIIDYSNTNKYKTIRSLTGYDTNGNSNGYGTADLYSGHWRGTAAISSITIAFAFGSNYQSGTKFALYGIKG